MTKAQVKYYKSQLISIRKMLNLTLDEAKELTGVDIENLENGKKKMTIEIALKLHDAYRVSLDALLISKKKSYLK